MANKFKLFGVIAVIAIIGIMVSCDTTTGSTNGGNGRVSLSTSILFTTPGQQIQQQPQANVLQARSAFGRSVITDNASFALYNEIYHKDQVGEFVRYITPTNFRLGIGNLYLIGNDGNLIALMLENHQTGRRVTEIDFANPVQVTPLTNAQSGFYGGIIFNFPTDGQFINTSRVTFRLPDGIPVSGELPHWSFSDPDPVLSGISYNPGNRLMTFVLRRLMGDGMPRSAQSDWLPLPNLEHIFYGGNTYKMLIPGHDVLGFPFPGGRNEIYFRDFMPSHNRPNDVASALNQKTGIVIPWAGIEIPEDETKTVRFEIRWDLTNIIAQYTGFGNTVPDSHHDVFVLRNDFWEGFSLHVIIE